MKRGADHWKALTKDAESKRGNASYFRQQRVLATVIHAL